MNEWNIAPQDVLERLNGLRQGDAPTHGGRVLSYVYDSGRADLDDLAAAAIRAVQPLNGLDPTTFRSVAVMERELVGFSRTLFHGDDDVVGSITSGGTESCLLAVKTARDAWRADGRSGRPQLLVASTVHAAFQKAAHYFELDLVVVPVSPVTGAPSAEAIIERLTADVALVVVSAPSYPTATLDPVAEVAAAAASVGVPVHVDACIGGFALPWWPDLPAWNFAVPGVTSLSADLHKYGYSPKGASVLLQRGRDRQRLQYFATTRWPGYPVVNSTMLGSKSAGPLAASWAIVQALGDGGLAELAGAARRATIALVEVVEAIDGLRVVGRPVGPLFAVTSDDDVDEARRVDPHRLADAMRRYGFSVQLQPGLAQGDGTRMPPTAHLTVTPVTERILPELSDALRRAADDVRGAPAARADEVLQALAGSGLLAEGVMPDSDAAAALLGAVGISDGSVPEEMAPLLALVEALPAPLAERLLTELLARLVEPEPRSA